MSTGCDDKRSLGEFETLGFMESSPNHSLPVPLIFEPIGSELWGLCTVAALSGERLSEYAVVVAPQQLFSLEAVANRQFYYKQPALCSVRTKSLKTHLPSFLPVHIRGLLQFVFTLTCEAGR